MTIDDFSRIAKSTPVLADLYPSGRYCMSHLVEVGGVLPLMRRLLEAGRLHGDCLTVTGHTLRENRSSVPDYPAGQVIIRPMDNAISPAGHLIICRGNLAPDTCVAKISGKQVRFPEPKLGPRSKLLNF